MAGQVTTTSNGQIVPRSNAEPATLKDLVLKMEKELARAIPKHMSADRMARVVLTSLTTTKDLAICTMPSFAGCVLQAAQLGLEPNTPLGHAYLIPRRNKNLPPDKRECTLIIGYQGYIELARRSGLVSSLFGYPVKPGDFFEYELGLHPTIKHRPSDDPEREDKTLTHVYAVAAMRDSQDRIFGVLSRSQVEKRRKRSAASGTGPWTTDYEPMALKTAVRALWPWLPKSAEIAAAGALDDAADAGKTQVTALDPMVSEMLQKQGLEEDPAVVDADGVVVDPNADESSSSDEQGGDGQSGQQSLDGTNTKRSR